MAWWEALLLGVVQGLTEFFPVSSSGHLVLGQEVLGIELPGITFDVAVHVATLLSVLVVYREKVLLLLRNAFRRGEGGTGGYILKLAVATLPTVVVGFTMVDWFEARFEDPVFAATMILITGSVVWSTRWALKTHRPGPLDLVPFVFAAAISMLAGTLVPFVAVAALLVAWFAVARLTARKETTTGEPTWGGAIIMGISQSIAIFPGISRSGSTVVSGLWHRIDPVAAAEFSFLMSIPAILGAAVLQVPDAFDGGNAVPVPSLIAGFVAAAVSGVLAIRFFVAMLRRQNFYVFAYYCWAVAALFLLSRT